MNDEKSTHTFLKGECKTFNSDCPIAMSESCQRPVCKTKGALRLSGVLILSAIFSLGAIRFTDIGFDFGYDIMQALTGGSGDFGQGVTASYALCFFVATTSFAWLFGILRSKSETLRNTLVLWGILALWLSFLGTDLNITDSDGLVGFTILSAIAIIGTQLAFKAGKQLKSMLTSRLNAKALLLPGLACLGIFSLTMIPGSDFHLAYPVEAALYTLAIAATTWFAARSVRAKTIGAAVAAGILTTLPVLVVNALNVFGNVLSLGLDMMGAGLALGWTALASALLITMAYGVGLLSGSVIYRRSKI